MVLDAVGLALTSTQILLTLIASWRSRNHANKQVPVLLENSHRRVLRIQNRINKYSSTSSTSSISGPVFRRVADDFDLITSKLNALESKLGSSKRFGNWLSSPDSTKQLSGILSLLNPLENHLDTYGLVSSTHDSISSQVSDLDRNILNAIESRDKILGEKLQKIIVQTVKETIESSRDKILGEKLQKVIVKTSSQHMLQEIPNNTNVAGVTKGGSVGAQLKEIGSTSFEETPRSANVTGVTKDESIDTQRTWMDEIDTQCARLDEIYSRSLPEFSRKSEDIPGFVKELASRCFPIHRLRALRKLGHGEFEIEYYNFGPRDVRKAVFSMRDLDWNLNGTPLHHVIDRWNAFPLVKFEVQSKLLQVPSELEVQSELVKLEMQSNLLHSNMTLLRISLRYKRLHQSAFEQLRRIK